MILAKTIKGYGMGQSGEAQNVAHQAKKMDKASLKQFRDRFGIKVTDEQIESGDLPYIRFAEDSEEMKYLRERRNALGGYLPQRNPNNEALPIPALADFDAQLQSSGDREFSTTMAFVRVLATLLKDKQIGKRIVPIVPDESRTFGMEGMFRQYGIWNPKGQQYTPQDKDQLMFYKESVDGQILQEGINEPGAMADWIAASTSYANNRFAMIPFYIYYSMFGFQRVGDLAWAAGDMHARGFLLGGTAGRTTLNGEGLQHEDGHSQVQADIIPNCVSYDPTFSYEVAVIVHSGLQRMYVDNEDVFFYITLMNENYTHPALPQREGIEEQILKGMYLLREGGKGDKRVQLMGSGTILREVIHAADLLKKRLRHRSRHLVLPLLQPAAPRRHRSRTLQPPAPAGRAQNPLRNRPASRPRRPRSRRHRLHPQLRRPHPCLHPQRLPRPRHRRIRPLRQPRQPALLL